jgi:hypothetical protein
MEGSDPARATGGFTAFRHHHHHGYQLQITYFQNPHAGISPSDRFYLRGPAIAVRVDMLIKANR